MKKSTYDSLSIMAKKIYDLAKQDGGVSRKVLSPQERKSANSLSEAGILRKGHSGDKHRTVCFFAEEPKKTLLQWQSD